MRVCRKKRWTLKYCFPQERFSGRIQDSPGYHASLPFINSNAPHSAIRCCCWVFCCCCLGGCCGFVCLSVLGILILHSIMYLLTKTSQHCLIFCYFMMLEYLSHLFQWQAFQVTPPYGSLSFYGRKDQGLSNSYRISPQTKVLIVPFFLVNYTQECGPASKINTSCVL